MATSQQHAQTVFCYAETKSIITVQRNYQREYGGNAPDGKTIKAWCEKFLATGSVKNIMCTCVSEEKMEEIRAGFQRSPQKSICQASWQLSVPRSTVYEVASFVSLQGADCSKLKPDDRACWK